MLLRCGVSQDVRRFRVAALVFRTDQDNLQSLMPFKHMPFLFCTVALNIRGSSLLCYVDTAEMLAFRGSGNALFSQSEMISVLENIFLYSPPTQMLMAQYY